MERVARILALALCLALVTPSTAGAVTPVQLQDVAFADTSEGLLSGGYGIEPRAGFLCSTTDGGVTWRPKRVEPTEWFRAVAVDPLSDIRWTLSPENRVFRIDGSVWTTAGVTGGGAFDLRAIEHVTGDTLVLVGRRGGTASGELAGIYRSLDGGLSWQTRFEGPVYPPPDEYTDPPSTDAELYAVDFADTTHGWAVGDEWAGLGAVKAVLIYRTTDAFSSWTTQTVTSNARAIYAVSAVSSSTAFLGGDKGTIWGTTDGGSSWVLKGYPSPRFLVRDMHFTSASVGVIVGEYTDVYGAKSGRIARTTDGGATWVMRTPAGYVRPLRAVTFASATHGWAVGDNETILRTTDGGVTWTGSTALAAPTVSTSAPASGTVLGGTVATVTVAASDQGGTGVLSVQTRIRRDDGRFWDGSAWETTETWLPMLEGAAGTWTYAWALEPGQARERTYSLVARATDTVENVGVESPGVTGVRVDNQGPELVSALAEDSTHVSLTFDEALDPGAIPAAGFSVAPGLSVVSASVVGGATVRLEVSPAQTPLAAYTVTAQPGAVADVGGNPTDGGMAGFVGFAATPVLACAPSPVRPTGSTFVEPVDGPVAVDALRLEAAAGTVTVTGISVRGLDTAPALTTDVSAVSLFADDGDGVLDPGDVAVGSPAAFSGAASGSLASVACSLPVVPGAARDVWVAYTMGGSAVDGHAVGSTITPTSDVTVTAAVVTGQPFGSANAGQTLRIDAAAPSIATTSPASGAVLTGGSAVVRGTASDGAGAGVVGAEVSLRRDDGTYWDGSAWAAGERWLPAVGTTAWTYGWTLEDGQDGERSYEVRSRATDAVGRVGSATPVTSVRVDNVGPRMTGASSVDITHVDVSFSETLAAAPATASISIPGITVGIAGLRPDGRTVRLTTTAHSAGHAYIVRLGASAVADLAGNLGTGDEVAYSAAGAGRVAGPDRYSTAIQVSRSTFGTDSVTDVVLATGQDFPDALGASALAGAVGGPLLLTPKASLPSQVASEVARVGAARVWIVGSEAAVSGDVASALADAGYLVERVAGTDRYATAARMAEKVAELLGDGFEPRAFVVRGDQFADALAVSPFAAANGFPVLLTPPTRLSAETSATLVALGIDHVLIAGSDKAVSGPVETAIEDVIGGPPGNVERVAGTDRYGTAAAIAAHGVDAGWGSEEAAGVATGLGFADALGGGVAMGARGGVLLLTDPVNLSSPAAGFLDARTVRSAAVFGSDKAVGSAVYNAVASRLKP